MLFLVLYCEVCEFDVEVLVDAVQCAFELQIVLQLHDHLLADQTLEELKEMLRKGGEQHSKEKRRAKATNEHSASKRREATRGTETERKA